MIIDKIVYNKTGPGLVFGSFFSENMPRVKFGMGFFSERPGSCMPEINSGKGYFIFVTLQISFCKK